jgi:transposase
VEHIAIDLGSRESQICVRNAKGDILDERRYPTPELRHYLAKRAPGARVLVESSAEAFQVADWALQSGHQAKVVPASLVRALGVGERGVKTDKRDARKLSEMDCRMEVPSIHIPSQLRREHHVRVTAREALVTARTKLVNTVRSLCRMQALPRFRATPKTLPKAVRSYFESSPEGIADYVESLLSTIEHLNAEVAKADEALAQIADSDPVCKNLQTMPGGGPVTSVCFAAALDEIGRFESASKVGSYLGLAPGENTTGFKTRRTGMTKAGPGRVRWTLTQAAWSMVRTQPETPLARWFDQVSKRRGKKIAITGLARKMAGILYAMWRDGKAFNPQKATKELSS